MESCKYIVNVVKCLFNFGMPIAYRVCNVDVVSVFCFVQGIGMCVLRSGGVFQMSGYE